MDEEWRVVPEFPRYEASSQGRIRVAETGRILKSCVNKDGYLQLIVTRDGREFSRRVHSLVALAFIGPRPSHLFVRHLDGDNQNNDPMNLTYGTHTENMADRTRHGRNPNLNKTHCLKGHKFTKENTRISKEGWRYCRQCHRDADRKRLANIGRMK